MDWYWPSKDDNDVVDNDYHHHHIIRDGQKMSKRLKNYPDPIEVVNKYGADALR